MKKILLLGASGSIGEQTIEIMLNNPSDFELVGFSVFSKYESIKVILEKFPNVKHVGIKEEDFIRATKEFPSVSFYANFEEMTKTLEYDILVNALVGFVGFPQTSEALLRNKIVALANKESLVVGGHYINEILRSGKGKLYPIDSEHVALCKCLKGKDINEVSELILTASGGSFRDLKREELENVTIKDALNHPSWNMGAKITIDSATMVNKTFEVIEAFFLFNIDPSKIKILLHKESIVHSMVKFADNSLLADLGPASMLIPISYALYEGNIKDVKVSFNIEDISLLNFKKFDYKRFPIVNWAYKIIEKPSTLGAIMNAANDVAVEAFLNQKIKFTQIEEVINKTLQDVQSSTNVSYKTIVEANLVARDYARKLIEEK